jgi:hypothetical protein
VAALGAEGCAHVDVKGREVLRVGPLRGVPVVAETVAPGPVRVDAGTDALTDDELADIQAALPAALQASFDRLAHERSARRVGAAHVDGCKLRAGPGKTATMYVAKCAIHVEVDGVSVVEVHAEALRRMPARAVSEEDAKAIRKLVRNPLLSADDSKKALEAALDAAAILVVDGALPPREDAPPSSPPLSREERLRLARERVARLSSSEKPASSSDAQAALFDLRSAGGPDDVERVLPLLSHADAAVRAAAVDAIGELCAPGALEKIEPLAVESADDALVTASARRAVARLRACGRITKP